MRSQLGKFWMAMKRSPMSTAFVVALIALLIYRIYYELHKVTPTALAAQEIVLTGTSMGSYYTVKVIVSDAATADKDALHQLIEAELHQVDIAMSTYKPDSELMRFNTTRNTSPFHLSPATFRVFESAIWMSRITNGLFDVTLGPLINAWGFGAPQNSPTDKHEPTPAELRELQERVGFQYLVLDPTAQTIRKRRADVFCDLSAIAPGFAADRIAQQLGARQLTNYMIDIGGELRLSGANSEQKAWQVAVQNPEDNGNTAADVIAMTSGAVATSGDYRAMRVTTGGKALSHIIDPRTARPIEHAIASVSVVHPDSAMLADAFATAFMVMSRDESMRLANDYKLGLMILERDATGTLSMFENDTWKVLRKKAKKRDDQP